VTETVVGSGVFKLTIGSVAAGANGTATFSVTVKNPVDSGLDDVENTVSIADDGTHGVDLVPDDNIATHTNILGAAPDLALTFGRRCYGYWAGNHPVYKLSYANAGNQDATGGRVG
jgi:hypothetical protein